MTLSGNLRRGPEIRLLVFAISVFAFAAKFLGSNPKIFLQVKAEGLEFFAFKEGYRSAIDHADEKANASGGTFFDLASCSTIEKAKLV